MCHFSNKHPLIIGLTHYTYNISSNNVYAASIFSATLSIKCVQLQLRSPYKPRARVQNKPRALCKTDTCTGNIHTYVEMSWYVQMPTLANVGLICFPTNLPPHLPAHSAVPGWISLSVCWSSATQTEHSSQRELAKYCQMKTHAANNGSRIHFRSTKPRDRLRVPSTHICVYINLSISVSCWPFFFFPSHQTCFPFPISVSREIRDDLCQ